MGKKRKLRELMHERGADESPALVICVGKDCAPRERSRALADDARAYAAATGAPVRVVLVGCLHVCEKGPIAASFPDIEFHERVDAGEAHEMIDKMARGAR